MIDSVLLVDDNPDLCKLAAKAITSLTSWHIDCASSARQALDYLATTSPSVILMDVSMPVMDGLTTLQQIQAMDSCCNTPVILITARVQKQELEAYTLLKIAGVIAKPFDPMALPEQVKKLVADFASKTSKTTC